MRVLDNLLYSFAMAVLDHPHQMTVTEATQRGVAGLISDAEQGANVVVTRHRRPVAAVVAYRDLEEFSRVAEDLRDLALVLARAATDNGNRTPLDDVLRAFGHTRESLAALPDDD
jgi:antitoxin (DNA-binding transcriptional repressor) of toxin-antitoxin stability system